MERNDITKNHIKYRNEWKFIINDAEISIIKNRINHIFMLDSHVIDGDEYTVHSLYFDDYKNSCARDNDAGVCRRYKWRIRYYNSDLSYICLEKKEKYNNLSRKKICQISIEDYNHIINNEINDVFWNADDKLLKEFCVDIRTRLFKPVIIVNYERTAYVEPITNIRITFDRNISVSNSICKFLTNDYTRYPIQEMHKNVMEIKFDDILPSYVKQTTNIKNLIQTSFSKYYLGRNMLERL